MVVDIAAELAAAKDDMIALRRDLHAHPELSFQEQRTAGIIADRLRAAGLEVQTGVAGTGVVALLRGAQPGKTLALRADIDALPITEAGDAPYRSQTPGVMHACGHDGHTAVAVTVASLLAGHRAALRGNVKFLFQPAEERIGGAKPMIDAGALRDPAVDAVVACHIWADLPVGKVGLRAGPAFASADEMHIVVKGRMGHGALPHQAVDSIAVAAQVIAALQTLVSREIDPLKPAVVTIGTIHGGTAFNIIAAEVDMRGTLRAFDMAVRNHLVERAEGLVAGLCAAMRAEYSFRSVLGCPPCVNDPAITDLVRRAAVAAIGAENVVDMEPTTGSDDMAYFLESVPGCYFKVGGRNTARGAGHPHHSPLFDFDEDALAVAARVLLQTVFAYLS